MKINVASFDLFHLVNQAEQLDQRQHLNFFLTTRARDGRFNIDPSRVSNVVALHYALRLLQRHWHVLGGPHAYLQLCRAFDQWLKAKLPLDGDLVAVLSGVCLHTFRKARRNGMVTVVDCGSTHTDFQHRIVSDELARCGIEKPLFPTGYRDRVRREFEEADYIQIPSRFVANSFIENGIPERKLLFATYGVDLARFSSRPAPDEASPFRVICPSGVNPRKGARVLVEAWRKLGWKDAELHWIGRPDETMRPLFQGKPETIIFHRWLEHKDLAALYRSCDAFVLPSFEEGFARVMLEGAASGLPLIVTPNTGIEDFFTPGEPEGWLIPVNDSDALCDALIDARKDRMRTYRLGARAADRARDFTWEAYGERVVQNYANVLGEPKRSLDRRAHAEKQS
jgi:glycosyltransferase involved in cell wall biosynthesis